MQLVRTTISLPIDLHDELRQIAFVTKKSMGEVLVDKLRGRKKSMSQVKKDWELFDLASKKGKKINLLAELRKDRGRDDE